MKNYTTELKWGIIFSLTSLAWIVLAKYLGMYTTKIDYFPVYSMLFIIPAVTVFYLALKDKKENFYTNQMTFVQGFMSGLGVTLVVTLLSPLSQYLFHNVFCPEFFPNAINYSVEKGKMTQTDAAALFNLKTYIIQSAVFSFIAGIITSVVIAFILRTKQPKN